MSGLRYNRRTCGHRCECDCHTGGSRHMAECCIGKCPVCKQFVRSRSWHLQACHDEDEDDPCECF